MATQFVSHKSAEMKDADYRNSVDLGIDYDWKTNTFKGRRDLTMDGKDYLFKLQEKYYRDEENISVQPRWKKGSRNEKYKITDQINDLNDQQKVIVFAAIESIVNFLNNDERYRPFRATVLGCGGTGKSFIINTISSIVKNYTNSNGSVKVAAPSGGAAYNVQGCTIHRLFGIDPNKPETSLGEQKKEDLRRKLKTLLALIIDERSMIGSKVLAASERNARDCAFGGQNSNEIWGGIPVVILFGDDYQLPPPKQTGAVSGFARRKFMTDDELKETREFKDGQLMCHHGENLFLDHMTDNVFHLTKNMRVSENLKRFKGLLQRVRIGKPSEEDVQTLKNLRLVEHKYSDEFIEQIENDPKTMWIFANNDPKDKKNEKKLKHTSNHFGVPVARMNCHYESDCCGRPAYKDHFFMINFPRETSICLNARVAIASYNFIPEIGLYNGARGTVVEMIFKDSEGPNNKQEKHLPEYVVVEFDKLDLPDEYDPWDRNHPKVNILIFYLSKNIIKISSLILCHS